MTVLKVALAATITGIILIFAATLAQADTTTPTQYQFTMSKIELCKSSACTSPTLLGQGSQAYDIGSSLASPGQSVGSFLSDFSLAPNQTFTHLRVTMARTFDITASATVAGFGGSFICVTGTGSDIVTASATTEARSEVTTGNAAVSQVLVVPDPTANNAPGDLATLFANEGIKLINNNTMTITFQLTSSFTTGDKVPNFDVAFDVADTIEFIVASPNSCFVILGPPSVTITIN